MDKRPFKVVFIGPIYVGKTSIIHVLRNGGSCPHPISTTCPDQRHLYVPFNGRRVELCIWDTPGNLNFQNLLPVYLRGSSAVVVVYDITDRNGFEELESWLDLVHTYAPPDAFLFLVGNKLDLADSRNVDPQTGWHKAEEHQGIFWETSAMTQEGIQELARDIAERLSDSPAHEMQPVNTIRLEETGEKPLARGGCCWW
jgi:small GTP-binding protein